LGLSGSVLVFKDDLDELIYHKTLIIKPEAKALPIDSLYKIIIESLDKYPRKYLFEYRGVKMSNNRFCKWSSSVLTRLFGVELNLTIVRQIYISSKDVASMTVQERKELGKQMGHTMEIQAMYEWK
jgi:hypothetical protein